jgi:hypothetical protein
MPSSCKGKRMELADKYQIYAKYEFPYEIGSQQYKDAVSFFRKAVAEKSSGVCCDSLQEICIGNRNLFRRRRRQYSG